MKPKEITPREIVIMLLKTNGKGRILKVCIIKVTICIQRNKDNRIIDFFSEIMQAQILWNDIFIVLKGHNCQPRITYLEKYILTIKAKYSFSD